MRESIILAAGFGTRMASTHDGPKGLIESQGRPMIDYLLDDLVRLDMRVSLITNNKHYQQYQDYLGDKIKIINNGVDSAQERNGALGDLAIAVNGVGTTYVFASDTAYWRSFRIGSLIGFSELYPDNFIVVSKHSNREEIRGRLGCPTLEGDRVVSFVEKPLTPPSDFAIVPFYVYRDKHLRMLGEYLEGGGNPDAPSNIIPYLLSLGEDVRSMVVGGELIDVGTPPDLDTLGRY